jgi:D-lactate dehydrogenase
VNNQPGFCYEPTYRLVVGEKFGIIAAMDVYFYEAFEEEVVALRQRLPETVAAGFTAKTIQETSDPAPPARLISIRTQSVVPASWEGALGGVVSRTTGYDHLMKLNIPAGYLPLYCSRAVAEQAALLWMALMRRLPAQMEHFARFDRDGLTGGECEGRNLLCVGVGNIGHEVVQIARGLGMQVRGVDIVHKHPMVRYVDIYEGLAWADVVVCAMNLTGDNAGYFDLHRLKCCPRGTVFVNISRGELSPPGDLLRLMEMRHLGGVALDVYDHESALAVALRTGAPTADESVRATLALAQQPNVILTPHNAFNTHEAVARKSQQACQQVEHFLRHGTFLWAVPV